MIVDEGSSRQKKVNAFQNLITSKKPQLVME